MPPVRRCAAADLCFAALCAACSLVAPVRGWGPRLFVLALAALLTPTDVGLPLRDDVRRLLGR